MTLIEFAAIVCAGIGTGWLIALFIVTVVTLLPKRKVGDL